MKLKYLSVLAGFIVLFCLYHAAEYMIIFKNSAAGFLGFQFLFFCSAWCIAKIQFKQGMKAWGLGTGKFFFWHLAVGMLMGIVLYGLTFGISVFTGAEKIISIPSWKAIAAPLGLFIFGNFFSSVSEDILTRGYLYKHFIAKWSGGVLVIISAVVYLLNHIYRLADGIETYTYLLMLGILFIIPVIRTQQLWFTSGMHWAGNCFFYYSHELIKIADGTGKISPNYLLILCILVLIPVNNFLLRRLR